MNIKQKNINIHSVSITLTSSIKDAMKNLMESGERVVLVLDDRNVLNGILTDGDLRKSLLEGYNLETLVSECMNKNPIVMPIDANNQDILFKMSANNLSHIPLIDSSGKVIELRVRPSTKIRKIDNTVVIMAGGEGIRLRPLTDKMPKPLLKIKDKAMLEIILDQFIMQGFYNFILTINYKKDMIKNYFGDGSRLGVNISYIEEEIPMGTAGSLSFLKSFTAPLIVMNADILTKANFLDILNHHDKLKNTDITMVVKPHEYKISYGVVSHENGRITGLEEKPVKTYHFNAGIYVLSENALKEIPNEYFDMTMLVEKMIDKGKQSSMFVLNDYWLDIGQMHDFKKANEDFNLVFDDK
tara:strand:+ start:6485 stop:7552 length:1068 start_codon:yes stop_codon:yes gene_type:complete